MSSQRKKILIVDKKLHHEAGLVDHLREAGYRVSLSDSGEMALRDSSYINPDIILLGVSLPGMNGFETCSVLKKDEAKKDIPIIFLLGKNEDVSKIKGYQAGGVDFIRKPIDISEATAHIETHLMIRGLHKSLEEKNRRLMEEINERKRVEENLRRQNEYFSALHETSIGLLKRKSLDDLLRAIVKRAASLVESSHGVLHLYDPKTGDLEVKVGLGRFEKAVGYRIKPGEGLVGRVWQKKIPMVSNNYGDWSGRIEDDVFRELKAYVAIPLKTGVGAIGLGSFDENRKEYGSEEIDLLNRFAELASIVLDDVRLFEKARHELAERKRAESTLQKVARDLGRKVKEKEVLLKEVHHRVKNNMQALIFLMELQAETTENRDTLLSLGELRRRVWAMALVHEKLYRASDLARINFGEYLGELTDYLVQSMESRRHVIVKVEAAPIEMSLDYAIPCGLIVNELVTNALIHAFPKENENVPESGNFVKIRFNKEEHRYVLEVSDNGVGLPRQMDWRKSQSLGLKLVNVWATRQLGGSLTLDPALGTLFTVTFTERKMNPKKG